MLFTSSLSSYCFLLLLFFLSSHRPHPPLFFFFFSLSLSFFQLIRCSLNLFLSRDVVRILEVVFVSISHDTGVEYFPVQLQPGTVNAAVKHCSCVKFSVLTPTHRRSESKGYTSAVLRLVVKRTVCACVRLSLHTCTR